MRKLRIKWDSDAIAVTDDKVVQHVDDLVDRFRRGVYDSGQLCHCGQSSVVHEIRVRVKKGELPHDAVVFIFNNEELPVHANGRMPNWPTGFCGLQDRQLDVLL